MKKVSALLLIVAMAFSLCACASSGDNSGKSEPKEPERESAAETVLKAMRAIRNYDEEAIEYYWSSPIISGEEDSNEGDDEGTDGSDSIELYMAMFENLSCEIISSEESETTATVVVALTNVDIKTAMSDAIATAFALLLQGGDINEDTIFEDELLKALETKKYGFVTTEVTIYLDLIDNRWIINTENMDDIFNAMIADAASLFE